MKLNKKVLAYSALAVVLIIALFLLALPPILRHVAINQLEEATGRKSEVAQVSINPFLLRAGISGVKIQEKGSPVTFLSFSSASVSLSPLSLPKRSYIVSELKLSSPHLHIVRNSPNDYNFSDLLKPKKTEKKGGTPLFSLNNITVENGSVDFLDKGAGAEKRHTLRRVTLRVPFVSNMPYLADRYVTPHFSAVVNGSPFGFDGRLKPLTKAVEATLSVNVKRLDLPYYLGYLPVPLPVKMDSGTLATALELGYRVNEKSGPELRVAGTVDLDHAKVSEPSGAPLLALDRVKLNMKNLWLLSRNFDLSSLELDGVELYAARDRLGKWNFQKIGQGKARPRPAETRERPAAEKPLLLRVGSFSLHGGKIHLTDAVPRGGFRTDLQEVEIGAQDFSLAPGHRGPFTVSLRSSRGENAKIKGELAASPLDVDATLSLTGIPLKAYYPYLADTLAYPVTGTLDVTSQLLFNEKRGLVLEKSSLTGKNLAAPFGGGDGFRLSEGAVAGVKVDLKQRKASVESVGLKGGRFLLTGEKDGTLSFSRLLRPQRAAAAPKPAAKRRATSRKEAAPFSYSVRKVTGADLFVKFTDKGKEDAPEFTLDHLQFALSGISGPRQGAIPFTLSSGYGNKGRVAAAGSFTPQPLKFKGNVQLQNIALRDFDAYMPEDTTIFIVDGALDTKMSVDLEKGGDGYRGSFAGSAGVRSFYCQDLGLDEDLLKWERLQIDRINGSLGPFTLAVKDVALTNFYSRVIVEKDGSLNLQHLMGEKNPPAAPGQPAAALQTKGTARAELPKIKSEGLPAAVTVKPVPAPAAAPGKESPAQPHPIKIETITMQGGTLSFSDRHLQSPFSTTFYNLGGRVSGLTSKANETAAVDLRGNLENHSPLSITGRMNPLRGDLFLDMQVKFTDIELSPFTPYSNTYLGYNVDKGKLFLDLNYHIEQKRLSSQNKVFIDQFTFGKEAKSDKATKLPVRLAIALLKDRKGEIHLNLPVTGSTDDPQFSVWKVVLHILKNMLAKAATAPFALLTSMFGGSEDFSAVGFPPGSDQLTKTEQEKLGKLAKVLQDRPALNLEISGFVDRERDPEGYRNELLLKKMKAEKLRTLAKERKIQEGQTQETVEILPSEYSEYLKAVYRKEKFPKPRNFIGVAKELSDEEMKKLILTHTVVEENQLQALARERAEAVKAFLQKNGNIPSERLFEKSSDIYKAPSGSGTGSRVEFGAKVK